MDKSYLTHLINTMTQREYQKDLHILIVSNRDIQIYHPEWLSEYVNLLFKISDCRDQSRLSKFICIDILNGKSAVIKNAKRQLLDAAWETQSIQNLHDLGWDLSPADVFTRSKLTACGNRKIESQIADIIKTLL